jgi:hypothetical protein
MVTRTGNGGDAFDAALRRRLGSGAFESTPACLVAELLAAYYERTLDGDARERCDAHLADCARCQAALGALARADAGAAVAGRRWVPAWSTGWRIAVPALAAALVLAVAVARMRTNVAVAPPEELASARLAEMRLQQAARAREAALAPPAAPPTVSELAMNEAARARPPGAAEAKTESRTVNPQRMAAMAKERATIRQMIASSAPGSVAGVPTVNNTEVAQAPVVGAPGAGGRTPAAGGQAPANAAAAGAAVGGMAGLAAVAPQFIVRAPDAVARWHVRAGDQIDYTPNGLDFYGSTTGVAAPLVAGSAPSTTVCWMVGRAGTVIRTTDGTHWTRLTSPTGFDLTSVSAENADAATVTDLNSRAYATSDGGRTWAPK